MSYEELKERISWGEEFSFRYNNEEYWISQNAPRRYLTKVNGSETQVFDTVDDLFENGRIEGKSLLEIWDDIKHYF